MAGHADPTGRMVGQFAAGATFLADGASTGSITVSTIIHGTVDRIVSDANAAHTANRIPHPAASPCPRPVTCAGSSRRRWSTT